ncbi:MAG: SURF1 family protein [Phenylobacterium sp.]|uniref:SURF1 family protein n=1 Tax=Phenylobacterium sp. TaxID=1871053 RepID=UPI001A5DC233|nr:SURF1 family cytochrome oxidase biogenesis protein [Phenylobacterium sp.]MBL8770399.1 SURF1 family protein [Phenylobacterium sp.]
MTADARRGFPVGLTVAVAVAFAILLALGTWQVQRLHWKEALLARVAALQAAPAQPVGAVLDAAARGAEADFTRVTATCPGLASAPFLELYGLREGQAGVRLVSACRVDSVAYRSVLVDRGFVADTVSARPPVDAANTAPVTVVGVLRRPDPANLFSPANTPRQWYVRDLPAMAAALNAPQPAPVTLMAETSTNPDWKALTPAPIPAEIANRHLEYAVTWYGLAGVLLAVYAALLAKRRKS